MSAEREMLAAEIHAVYCRAYEKRFGKPYWTGGDYSKLDEPTKDYDRAFVDWHIARLRSEVAALKEIIADAEFVVRGGDKDMALKILRGEVERKKS